MTRENGSNEAWRVFAQDSGCKANRGASISTETETIEARDGRIEGNSPVSEVDGASDPQAAFFACRASKQLHGEKVIGEWREM